MDGSSHVGWRYGRAVRGPVKAQGHDGIIGGNDDLWPIAPVGQAVRNWTMVAKLFS
jgi:hypothetical protein